VILAGTTCFNGDSAAREPLEMPDWVALLIAGAKEGE